MPRSNPKLKALFRKINRLYYNGRLSDSTVVEFRRTYHTSRGRRKANLGQMMPGLNGKPDVISIDPTLRRLKLKSVIQMTLIHEIAHIAAPEEKNHHGRKWLKEMHRLARLGAFDSIW
jgi:hypothetical protein